MPSTPKQRLTRPARSVTTRWADDDTARSVTAGRFTQATSANTKTLFLNFTKEALTVGTGTVSILQGGFFTDADADFLSLINNATWDNAGFQVYVLGDGQGTDNRLNGQGYYNWRNPAMFGWTQSLFASTEVVTGDFADGSSTGRILTLAVAVPEPSGFVLAGIGSGLAGFLALRRRRQAGRRDGVASDERCAAADGPRPA